jgi:hypothetical protein
MLPFKKCLKVSQNGAHETEKQQQTSPMKLQDTGESIGIY